MDLASVVVRSSGGQVLEDPRGVALKPEIHSARVDDPDPDDAGPVPGDRGPDGRQGDGYGDVGAGKASFAHGRDSVRSSAKTSILSPSRDPCWVFPPTATAIICSPSTSNAIGGALT